MEILIGRTYIVHNKSKNHGRKVIVLDFVENGKAKVKYVDNGRNGKVILNDLEGVNIEHKEKLVHKRKNEILSLIEDEYAKIREIEKKIEQLKIELLSCERELENQ